MKILSLWSVVLFFCVFVLSCGGSGSSSSDHASSSQESYSSTPIILKTANDYVRPQSFQISESETLSQKFDIKISSPVINLLNTESSIFGAQVASKFGGTVTLWESGLGFDYIPPADFFGEDEFTYIIQPEILGLSDIAVRVRIPIVVNAVVNEPRMKWFNNKIFVAEDVVELSPYTYAMTGIQVPPDATTKIIYQDKLQGYEYKDGKIFVKLDKFSRAGVDYLTVEQTIENKVVTRNFLLRTRVITPNYELYWGDLSASVVTVAVVFDADENPVAIKRWRDDVFEKFLLLPIVQKFNRYFAFVLITKTLEPKFAVDKIVFDSNRLHQHVQNLIGKSAIVVGIGSDVNGGWASGPTIGINIQHGLTTFLHELGHAVGRLADEYEPAPRGNCGEIPNPNMSYQKTAETVPWAHWIENPASVPGLNGSEKGVGVFEGAWCLGAYRPMFNSIMRGSDVLGPIFTEAWALRLYEELNFLGGMQAQLTEGVRYISLPRTVNPANTGIKWYLNGQEITDWENLSQIQINEQSMGADSYRVEAELQDKLGFIRKTNAYVVFNTSLGKNDTFRKEWKLTPGEPFVVSNVKQKLSVQEDWRNQTYICPMYQ